MQVSVETLGTLERRITVEVPEERVRGELAQRLRDLSRKVRVDGFRVGKVPLKVVEHRYGAELRREVVGELLRSSFEEAIRERDMHPAGDAAIEPVTMNPGEGLVYKATFEVYPQLALRPVEVLRVKKAVCDITEEDVARAVAALQHQLREWEEVDRPAEPGDLLELDYVARENGVAIEGGSVKGAKLELSNGLPPGLAEALSGARAGDERTVDVEGSDPVTSGTASGRTVRLEIKVHKVSRPVLPALDETLAARLGVKEGGLEGLRAAVRAGLERQRDREVQRRLKREVLQALVAANPVDLPKVLVEHELLRLLERASRSTTPETRASAEWSRRAREAFEPEARRGVARALIIGEIVRVGGLTASAAMVRAAVEGIAAGFADPGAVVKWYYEDRSRLTPVKAAVLENEAVAWVVERAQVEEQHVTFDELGDPRQTGPVGDMAHAHAQS